MQTILDIVNVSTGRNTATDDKFPRRIINEKYDAGFTAKLQLKDIKLYLENARASGHQRRDRERRWWACGPDWTRPSPAPTSRSMYPYTRDGRRKRGRSSAIRYANQLPAASSRSARFFRIAFGLEGRES